MKKIIMSIVILFPVLILGQNQETITHKRTNAIYYKWLMGKWRSIDDNKSELEFNKSACVFLYENDKAATFQFKYRLSTSCQEKDSLQRLKFNELDNVNDMYLLLIYDQDHAQDDCYYIEKLDSQTLSWTNVRTGKLFVFDKVAAKKRNTNKKK
jgi:hypothetical protein